MQALVQQKDRTVEVQTVSVPKLDDKEVLVKIEYVALNPTDWKQSSRNSPPGAIHGCDLCGAVVSIGPNVANAGIRVGVRVAAAVHGSQFPDKGACAEYARVASDLCWLVPEGVRAEDAATFGVGFLTAAQSIIHDQKLSISDKPGSDQWFVVYGGSTSVGLFAIQIAKQLGFRVITFCSPSSFDLVKQYGADAAFDYHDGVSAADQALAFSGGVHHGLDCIARTETITMSLRCFAKGPGQLNVLGQVPEGSVALPAGVKIGFITTKTLFGRAYKTSDGPLFPASPQDREFGVKIYSQIPELITSRGIKPNPVEVLEGGLAGIPAGWERLRTGKVSGRKLVARI